MVPAGTPPQVIAKLTAELARIVSSPETKGRLAHLGLYPADELGPEALAALIQTEVPRWRKIVREAGIRAD